MTAVLGSGVRSGPSLFRRFAWRHPEWWLVVVASAAWSAVALTEITAGPGGAGAVGAHAHHGAAPSTGGSQIDLGMVAAMAVAMMAPLSLPTIRYVALTSLWGRRYRAQALFLAGYLGVWVVAGLVLAAMVGAVAAATSRTVGVTVCFGAATAWSFSSAKRRALRRCGRTASLSPRGWRADRDCLTYGASSAVSCVVTCWAVMAAATAAGHGIAVMAGLFAVQLRERLARVHRPRLAAAFLATLGVVLVAGPASGGG